MHRLWASTVFTCWCCCLSGVHLFLVNAFYYWSRKSPSHCYLRDRVYTITELNHCSNGFNSCLRLVVTTATLPQLHNVSYFLHHICIPWLIDESLQCTAISIFWNINYHNKDTNTFTQNPHYRYCDTSIVTDFNTHTYIHANIYAEKDREI